MKEHELDAKVLQEIRSMTNPTTLAVRDRLNQPIIDVMASLKRLYDQKKIALDRNVWRAK